MRHLSLACAGGLPRVAVEHDTEPIQPSERGGVFRPVGRRVVALLADHLVGVHGACPDHPHQGKTFLVGIDHRRCRRGPLGRGILDVLACE
jgi:hypothetical protein